MQVMVLGKVLQVPPWNGTEGTWTFLESSGVEGFWKFFFGKYQNECFLKGPCGSQGSREIPECSWKILASEDSKKFWKRVSPWKQQFNDFSKFWGCARFLVSKNGYHDAMRANALLYMEFGAASILAALKVCCIHISSIKRLITFLANRECQL